MSIGLPFMQATQKQQTFQRERDNEREREHQHPRPVDFVVGVKALTTATISHRPPHTQVYK